MKDIKINQTYRFLPRGSAGAVKRKDPRFDSRAKVLDYYTAGNGSLVYAVEFADGVKARATADNLAPLRPGNAAIDAMIDSWDGGDVWGSAMGMLGAVCDVMTVMTDGNDIDPGAGYGAPMGLPDNLEMIAADVDHDFGALTSWLAESVIAGDVKPDDLRKASRILSLYLDLAREAGKDY